MDFHLRGKRAIITGASKGIGAAAAEAFAEEGCHLRIAARGEAALREVASRLRAAHGVEVTVHVADLRQSEDVTRLGQAASDCDILINNAGDIPGGSLGREGDDRGRMRPEIMLRHAEPEPAGIVVFSGLEAGRLRAQPIKVEWHRGILLSDVAPDVKCIRCSTRMRASGLSSQGCSPRRQRPPGAGAEA